MPDDKAKLVPKKLEKLQIKRRSGSNYGRSKKGKKLVSEISELNQRAWSVITFEKCIASKLTYAEAFKQMKNLSKESGLCIVTDEAASRIKKK